MKKSKSIKLFYLMGVVALSLTFFAQSEAKTWERDLAPGMTYRMEWLPENRAVIHAFCLDLSNPNVKLCPELCGEQIFSAKTPVQGLIVEKLAPGRETVTQAVSRTKAFAGITGSFFNRIGEPEGLLISNGDLIHPPYNKPRGVFGWGSGPATSKPHFVMGVPKWQGVVQLSEGEKLPLTGFNQPCSENAITFCTDRAGFVFAKTPSVYIRLKCPINAWHANIKQNLEVIEIQKNWNSLYLLPGQAMLVARGDKEECFKRLKKGDQLCIQTSIEGDSWSSIQNAIGGGPFLVQKGDIKVDFEEQQFTISRARTNRYARTAIGHTQDHKIWLVNVDGPSSLAPSNNHAIENYSAGVTLDEMAKIMKRLGCINAMNLDGGGSSTFTLFEKTFNRPSSGADRRVADALVIYVKDPGPCSSLKCKIFGPHIIRHLEGEVFSLNPLDGSKIDSGKIIWNASGSAWIDQYGALHPLQNGKAAIHAYYQGQTFSVEVEVNLDKEALDKQEKNRKDGE